MKCALCFIGLWIMLSCAVSGQQLLFYGQRVDTIKIKSHVSAFQFDDKGTTIGRADFISWTYDPKKNQYVIDRYYRDEYKQTFRPDTFELDTKVYNSEIGKRIDLAKMESLLSSFSPGANHQDIFSQIDTTKLKALLTWKQIRKVARSYGIDWHFKRRYSTKEENNAFFAGCSSMDTVKVYLTERFDTSGYAMITTDYSNSINIWISTPGSEYSYKGKFPNPVKQPWYNLSDPSPIPGEAILNLRINQSLYELLPEDFLLKASISELALVNDYIEWYFERREIHY